MPVYTVRFCVAQLAAPGASDAFVTPSTDTYIIRDMVVANAAPDSAGISVVLATEGLGLYLFVDGAMPASTARHVDCRVALLPGDRLVLNSSQPSAQLIVTGYRFGP